VDFGFAIFDLRLAGVRTPLAGLRLCVAVYIRVRKSMKRIESPFFRPDPTDPLDFGLRVSDFQSEQGRGPWTLEFGIRTSERSYPEIVQRPDLRKVEMNVE